MPDYEEIRAGTEAGIYAEIGIPTMVLGPGSLAEAHMPDEFIEVSQLVECLALIERLETCLGDPVSE